jgi:DNA-binding transcriptional MerR regulator
MEADLSSGDLSRATGCTPRAIRFYEEQGLLRPTVAREGGHRRYTAEDLERLRLISDLRELGLGLQEIRTALDLRAGCQTGGQFAERFEAVLLAHIRQAEQRLTRLRRVKRELEAALGAIQLRLRCDEVACPCEEAPEVEAPRIVRLLGRGICAPRTSAEPDEA